MSLPLTSWQQRVSCALFFALDACGGAVSDDANQNQSAGGTSASTNWSAATGSSAPLSYSYPFANVGGYSSVYTVGNGGTWRGAGGTFAGQGAAVSFGGVHTGGTKSLFGGGGYKPVGGGPASGGIYVIAAGGGAKPTGGRSSTGGSISSGVPTYSEDVCKLVPDAGTCEAYSLKYYFNPFHGQCEQFVYGGCGGNPNRFDTLEECQNRCSLNSPLCPSEIPPTDELLQCALSSVCYYQETSGCACLPQRSASLGPTCNVIDPVCEGGDADASSPAPDAGTPGDPNVVLCTCGSPAWTCVTSRLRP